MIRHLRRRRVWIRMVGICAVGCAAGFFANAARDRGKLSWSPGVFPPIEREASNSGILVIRRDAFREALARGGIAVDARSPSRYRAGHVPGAISFPVDEDFDGLLRHAAVLFEADWIGVYGTDAFTDDGLYVARLFREIGLTNAHLYVGGYEDWQRGRRGEERP